MTVEVRLVGEADGDGRLGGRGTGVQEVAGPAYAGVGQPGVGRHPVGIAERSQQRERAGAEFGGEQLQSRGLGHPLVQHGTRACRDMSTGGAHGPLRQRASVQPQQPGHGHPQQGVGGERVALLRGPEHLVDETCGVRVVEHGADESGSAADRGGLGGDLGHQFRGRVHRPVPPALGDAGAAGVRSVGVDQRQCARARVLVGAAVVEDLDAFGDGGDDEVLVGMPHEDLLDVPGPQQIDTGQFRVLPVPRPLRRSRHTPILRQRAARGGLVRQ